MPQPVLSKSEKVVLRAAISDMKGTIASKGNAPLPEREMNRNQQLCTRYFTTLCRLHALLPQIRQETEEGFQSRVEFVKLIWLAGIASEVSAYVFYDIFEVGDREYGLCFEADGGRVMNELVRLAKKNKALLSAALSIYTEAEWLKFQARVAAA